MSFSKVKQAIRESIGNVSREVKVALTPIPKPQKWVFLVGCYNSGTTLLSEVLSHHKDISALSTEGHFITDQFVKDFDIGLPRMWVDREDLFRLNENEEGPDANRIKKEWGMRLDCSKPVLLEKSPPNSARTRWLEKHFENAHFIAIIRNGYAVSEGISRKGDPKHIAGGWPIERSARQWARSNEILLEDAKHLKRFMTIKYEDLTADFEGTLKSIFSFIDLEPEMAVTEEKSFNIHERNEKIRDMNAESICRLTEEDITKINQVAGPMLEQLGYEKIDPQRHSGF